MKKLLSSFLVLAMVLAVPCMACAADTPPDPDTSIPGVETLTTDPVDSEIDLYTLTKSFSNLGPGQYVTSSETYYIEDADTTLVINSATWNPASQTIRIGFINVDDKTGYYRAFTGGDVTDQSMNSKNIPDGDYKIYIKNMGTKAVTGAVQYDVEMY